MSNKNPFGDVKFERKPSGAFIVDGIEVAHTLCCCHCNAHFVMVRNSGRIRGFCMKCMQITCGRLECNVCIPFERKLEMMERHG